MIISEKITDQMKDLGFTFEQLEFLKTNLMKEIFRNNGYKVRTGVPYVIFKQYFKDYVFYKIPVYSKDKDGREKKAYKEVLFVNCDPVREDKDKIILKSFFEDFYFSANDRYNPRWVIKILDYEYAENEDKDKRNNEKALEQYSNELDNNWDDLPF